MSLHRLLPLACIVVLAACAVKPRVIEMRGGRLQSRLDAALAIQAPADRDTSLHGVALEAAAAGEGEIVLKAIGAISQAPTKTDAASRAALDLGREGYWAAANEVAKLIPHTPTRDQILKRLAEGKY